MPKQAGIFKMRGTVDDATFYQSPDGLLVRKKSTLSAEKIATDPKFKRTRENNSEFSVAQANNKLIREAFNSIGLNAKDRRTTSRLFAVIMAAKKKDVVNARGFRNMIDGDMQLLKDFEFNTGTSISSVVKIPVDSAIDRMTGELTLDLPAYVPEELIIAPPTATHLKMVLAGAELDFANNQYEIVAQASTFIPWTNVETPALSLTAMLPAASVKPLFLAMGVEFYQEVSGQKYPLKDGGSNALKIDS
jgi:hypothetical protein